MFQAQYLFGGDSMYSPWMARGGDRARVSAELIERNNTDELHFLGYTKNKDEAGDGTFLSGEPRIILTGVGQETVEWTGLKELVRYRVVGASSDEGDFWMFRLLPMIWFDAVDAST